MAQRSIEVLAEGLGLVESPRWVAGSVLFSDWTAGRILRWSGERLEVVFDVPSLPLCFDVQGDGDVLVLDGAHGSLLRGRLTGGLRPWVDVSALAAGGANEVLAAPSGVYLNFGNFDPRAGFPTEAVGLIVHVTPDGDARVVATGLAFPNGMGLTDDGRLLVAESHAHRISAWCVQPDGGLAGRHTWAETPGLSPDGITLTPQGSCWLADIGSRSVVHISEGGRVLERIELDRGAFSCVHVAEHDTLYITAAHWPGGPRMFDPGHVWDGRLIAAHLD